MTQRPGDRQTQIRDVLNQDLSRLENILQEPFIEKSASGDRHLHIGVFSDGSRIIGLCRMVGSFKGRDIYFPSEPYLLDTAYVQ